MNEPNRFKKMPPASVIARRLGRRLPESQHYAKLVWDGSEGNIWPYEIRCACGFWAATMDRMENHITRERRKK